MVVGGGFVGVEYAGGVPDEVFTMTNLADDPTNVLLPVSGNATLEQSPACRENHEKTSLQIKYDYVFINSEEVMAYLIAWPCI